MIYQTANFITFDVFFYDIGIRAIDDPLDILSKYVNGNVGFSQKSGRKHPRFLEDFVEEYGEKNVKVLTPLGAERDVHIDTKKIMEFCRFSDSFMLNRKFYLMSPSMFFFQSLM